MMSKLANFSEGVGIMLLSLEKQTSHLVFLSAWCSGMLQVQSGPDSQVQEPMRIRMFSPSCFLHV